MTSAPEQGTSAPVVPALAPGPPLVGPKLHLALAALTGLFYYLGFPGADLWPFAFFAWTPWLLGLEGRTPKQAALGGLVIGIVVGVLGFYWLLEMLRTFSGFPTPLCALFMLILCAYQGGRFSLLGWLYARGEMRGHPAGLLFSLAFVASETIYPMLFPFTFAASVHQIYPLVQIAEIGGPSLVALTLIASSYLLFLLVKGALVLRKNGSPRSFSALAQEVGRKKIAFLLAVPVVSALYGLLRIQQVDAAVAKAEKVKVGLVQANMGLAEKRTDFREGQKRHFAATRKLKDEDKVDLVVWSETSLAGATDEKEAERYYGRLGKRLGIPTIMGAVLSKRVNDARRYALYNSALLIDAEGRLGGRYDKQYLLAFGEYLPLGETFPILYSWSPNSGHFTPGNRLNSVRLGRHKISVFICYEDIIPGFVNDLANAGSPELLVNMTNDAWFGDTSEPWEHMALSTLRAVEQRRFLVRSTNSGISGFVDPVGRILQKTGTFEQAAVAQELAYLELWSPFRVIGKKLDWLLSFAALFLSFWRKKTEKALA